MGAACTASKPELVKPIGGVIAATDYVLSSFTQVLEVDGTEAITITAAPDDIDVDWTISGSAGQSYTFDIQCTRN